MNQDLYSAIYKEVSQTLPEYTKDLNVSIQDGIKILIEFLENAPQEEGNEHACSNFYQTLCDVFAYQESPLSLGTKVEPLFQAMTSALKPKPSLFFYLKALSVLPTNIVNKLNKEELPKGWEGTIYEDFHTVYRIRNKTSHNAKHYSHLELSIYLQKLCRVLCYVAMTCYDVLNPLFAENIVHVRTYLDKKEETITTLSELHSFLSGDYDTLHQFCQGNDTTYDWLAKENKQYSHAKHCGYITLWALGMYVKLTNDTEKWSEIDYSFIENTQGYFPLYAIPSVLCNINTKELNLKNQFITELPPEIAQMNNTKINLTNCLIKALPAELGTHEEGPTLFLCGNPITELPPELLHIKDRVWFTESEAQKKSKKNFHRILND